jgi:tartrate dehydrogenase/decarboxylase/D-malate dehydrogenase
MLDHLGHGEAATAIEGAIETVLGDPLLRTPDMDGKGTTVEVGKAVEEAL